MFIGLIITDDSVPVDADVVNAVVRESMPKLDSSKVKTEKEEVALVEVGF